MTVCAKMCVPMQAQKNATGYFNVLNDEGRVVVGALLAMDEAAPLPEVRTTQRLGPVCLPDCTRACQSLPECAVSCMLCRTLCV